VISSPPNSIVPELESYMDKLRKSGESCGARRIGSLGSA